ncbi:nucleolar protein 12-domain-containing protein [Catenaria anguillulae PL171]|uniref:Nucleolar protein 12-domain-containing protein n=1 Tax=Catenaria anguillulae PL171 TaxID=765915 RepID=A0A1Y2HUX4_9FUNG|nr:nucleolar protein 12-domain-containing protein [Catenaria anguillulae PL171]
MHFKMSSNIDLLTRSSRAWQRKRSEKQQDLEIKFDDSARKEYLTGFHKRNVERRNKRVEHAKEMARKERNENRAEKRRQLAELARQMTDGRHGRSTEPSLSDDEHDPLAEAAEAFKAPVAVAAPKVKQFKNEQLLTTVTVSDLQLGPQVAPLVSLFSRSSAMSDDGGSDDDAMDAHASGDDDDNPFAAPKSDDEDGKSKKKTKKKVFKYETKKERQETRKAQLEKAKKNASFKKVAGGSVGKKKAAGGGSAKGKQKAKGGNAGKRK